MRPCTCMNISCRVLSLSAFSHGTFEENIFKMIGATPTWSDRAESWHAESWPQVAQTSAVRNGRSTRLQHQATIPASRKAPHSHPVRSACRVCALPSESPTTLYNFSSTVRYLKRELPAFFRQHAILLCGANKECINGTPFCASKSHTHGKALILIC